MTTFEPDTAQLRDLKDKVIVLSGGANGIGAATVEILAQRGALVVFGDVNTTSGEQLASEYDGNRVLFQQTDVAKYEDSVTLFKFALKHHGRVDHALAIAGVLEQGNIFDPSLTIEDVEKPPTNQVIDVNLTGVLYFTRVAVAYLSHEKQSNDDKSIVLVSSVSGFCDSPGLVTYGASKHGVLGLMRCLRQYLLPTFGIRINAVAPLATATAMIPEPIRIGFSKIGVPTQSPAEVAQIILGLMAGSHKGKNGDHTAQIGLGAGGGPCNGLTIYVEGGRGSEIEEGLVATRDKWMGKEFNDRMKTAMTWLASGAAWTEDQQ